MLVVFGDVWHIAGGLLHDFFYSIDYLGKSVPFCFTSLHMLLPTKDNKNQPLEISHRDGCCYIFISTIWGLVISAPSISVEVDCLTLRNSRILKKIGLQRLAMQIFQVILVMV